ncbi:hypothetical protein ATCC90586_003000 [Pythium insidiosum]|nr:hypothetical protein ATCC90586_003000 [Pythium insidiosum]
MHRSIMESVDQVQDRTSKILQEQEKDLLRAFRARLYSVQEELESEKNKTDDGASAWIEKSKQLETEVEWTKELADRLDRLNQSLTRENQRLKTQFATQENDREYLVKQLVTVKKDNVRLRNEYEEVKQQLEALKDDRDRYSSPHTAIGGSLSSSSTSALPRVHSPSPQLLSPGLMAPRPNTALGSLSSPATATPEADTRYKEIIKRQKRLLEVERRNLQQVRTAYKTELHHRTELEMILKECIQDVRAEIAQVASSAPATPTVRKLDRSGSQNGGLTTAEPLRLTLTDRQRLIEKLLAKERLLNLLTTKAFPIRHSKDPLLSGDALSPEEITRMYADVAGLTERAGGGETDVGEGM